MHADRQASSSRALFSVPTGLESVGAATTRSTVARAKQASVLFDEIVVESGLKLMEMSAEGIAAVIQRGPGSLSEALLRESRQVPEHAKHGIAVVPREGGVEIYVGTNLPRIDEAFYVERELTGRYVGEYHTGILQDLAKLQAPWVRVVDIKRPHEGSLEIDDGELTTLPEHGDIDDLITKIRMDSEQAVALGKELQDPPEGSGAGTESPGEQELADYSAKGLLSADLAEAIELGDRLDAVPALSGAFAEVASERGVPVGLPGVEALGFIVPNFSALPWEAVAEFRDHPGAIEAREKLREFDAAAEARGGSQTVEAVRATGRAVTTGLLGAVDDLAPKLPDEIGKHLASTSVGLIPVVGQYASLALSVGDMIAALRESERFDQSWVAAVFELRESAVEATIDW